MGVLVGGLVLGCLLRGVFCHFLKTRSFPAFLLALQICFTPVLKHTPVLFFLIAQIGISAMMKASNFAFETLRIPVPKDVIPESLPHDATPNPT